MNKRRKFLKELGMGALATPLATSGLVAQKHSTVSRLRIGVMVPHSKTVARLGECVENGFKVFFNNTESPKIDLIKQDIGAGSSKEVYEKASRLLSDEVDLVIGIVNPMVTPNLIPLFQENGKIFIELSMGERIPSLKDMDGCIFRHNLHFWQSSFATGRWAAQQYGKTAIICSSLYDSGYDTVYAFRRGFENEGGQIAGTYIINDLDDMPNLVKSLKEAQPSVVYGLFSGNPAAKFLQEYTHQGLTGNIPLVASRFLLSDESLMVYKEKAASIHHIFPWSRLSESAENRAFVSAYENQTGRQPNEHALLGYEAAQWIDAAFRKIRSGSWAMDDLAHALQTSSFTSPRGKITVNEQNTTESSLYLQQTAKTVKGYAHQVVEQLPDSLAHCEECLRESLEEVRSGWMNPYLAV